MGISHFFFFDPAFNFPKDTLMPSITVKRFPLPTRSLSTLEICLKYGLVEDIVQHLIVSSLIYLDPECQCHFFFDPAFNAVIDSKSMRSGSLVLRNAAGEEDVVVIDQTIKYGEYITHKVAHVFPELFSTSGGQDRLSSSKLWRELYFRNGRRYWRYLF